MGDKKTDLVFGEKSIAAACYKHHGHQQRDEGLGCHLEGAAMPRSCGRTVWRRSGDWGAADKCGEYRRYYNMVR